MSILRQIVVVGVLAALAVAGWTFARPLLSDDETGASGASKPKPAAAVVAEVTFAAERISLEAVGTARAAQSAILYAPAAGEVKAVNFSADETVAAGDVLLELDREGEELAVELARVRRTDADRIVRRLRSLSRSGAVAQATLDDALTTLEAARIALRQAEVDLADRFVIAPFSGRIGLSDIDVGDRISSDTRIATLDDRSSLLVRFEVPEALLGRIAVGETASVVPWTSADITAEGTVYDVDSRVDEANRSFTVRARIPNQDDRLRPGMSFRVNLDIEGPERPRVPEIAIQWGGDGSFVWVVRNAEARRVPVTILQRQEALVLVDADIDRGDLVVVEGLHRMRPGAPVEILPEGARTPAPIPARLQGAGS
ncbi:efflux RND transporter periplasmic adaptor subunit [Thalassobaculum sp. OXR-137]|uniref:efflux RND transporter periplasmic adaptor subunit n=1 Tax=Thalassobaculum sp. OXR-137 TaxID=3100173 RepID=UPI002AC8A069|nr:efflux RND transporter periplasmic adaptor subunit [Thalassobaculum sp. OXR-137]WPZ34330.1 efflux RND transporter periplasmic adaptor subunit [Thalassobaculum sp. OXR-137]